MTTRKLSIASYRWDTTKALLDGHVGFDGIEAALHTGPLPVIFEGMLARNDYDVCELGITYYLRALEAGASLVALPVFPARAFRHSSVWVSAASGITEPRDLHGHAVGEFGLYGQDSGIWAKGILAEEFGFEPDRCRWLIGGLDEPMGPFSFVPQPHPADVDVASAPEGRSLSQLLAAGEIAALFTSNVPQPALDASPEIRPLFPDYELRERDYYRRTGIFPVMHTVVARRELIDADPGLARTLFRAYQAAKDAAAQQYLQDRRVYEVTTMVPWMNSLVERNHELLGPDWWPYGIAANRQAIDTMLRYHHEQGVTRRRWQVDEIFAGPLLDT